MSRALTLAGYLVIILAMATYEVAARRRGRATFADMVNAVTRTRTGTALLLIGWLWIGWHLFVRASE